MPVELLAPVQNFKALHAAVPYAHAVYFGVELLNMRMRAENFKTADLPAIVQYCHDHGVKAYLATNVILYNNELEYASSLIGAARDAGIDAVIVQDTAAIEMCKDVGMPFHISTQASISNLKAAQFYERLGAERLILARELSLVQIAEIKQGLVTAQVECFIHGAAPISNEHRTMFEHPSDNNRTGSLRAGCANLSRQA